MKKKSTSILKKLKRLVIIAFLLHLGYVVALVWMRPPITITMVANYIGGKKIIYEPTDYASQGKQLKLAAIAGEDQKFPNHFGLDFDAIKGAIEYNEEGKKIRGGSTITQQTSKNVFFWQGRDWIRKGLEAYSSLLTEIIWGKQKILEHYLNVAEMGEGIYGVKAASKHYFGKAPDQLSAEQAAMIIACLPNPKKMNPNNRTAFLLKKQKWILRQMRNLDGDPKVKKIIANKS